jgi:hypothetical protein
LRATDATLSPRADTAPAGGINKANNNEMAMKLYIPAKNAARA